MTDLCRLDAEVSRETLASEFERVLSSLRDNTSDLIKVASFPPVRKECLNLYPVVDSVQWVARLLKMGVKTVQLRIKDKDQPNLEEQICDAVLLGREFGAQVFINDYWQLAVKHRAYGVHLGQEDLDVADLNQIRAAGLRLGISTHSYEELFRAVYLKPSYIALGHIFPTTTKKMSSKPQGLLRLSYYQQYVSAANECCNTQIPTVAIGGINLNNAKDVLSCGVDSLAVVRAITQPEDCASVLKRFQGIFDVNERGRGE